MKYSNKFSSGRTSCETVGPGNYLLPHICADKQ